MVAERDITLADGRTLHVYDTGGADRLPVLWHHGTPNIGAPPEPLFAVADRLGLRWFAFDRPNYGGSSPLPGRSVGSGAADAVAAADALGIERFAVMGHSGGGPHALGCAALLGDRVIAAVSASGLAPYGADDLDWYAGMAVSGRASLAAAAKGREAKERHETSGVEYDPEFTPDDLAQLSGAWSWLGRVVEPAVAAGPGGLIDDDLAYVNPWGFDPSAIRTPVLVTHGVRDRIVPSAHGRWLASQIPGAELRLFPDDGHISVLKHAPASLEWIATRTGEPI